MLISIHRSTKMMVLTRLKQLERNYSSPEFKEIYDFSACKWHTKLRISSNKLETDSVRYQQA